MGKLIDVTGQRFDKLVVLNFSHSKRTKTHSARHWRCKCDCGNEVILRYDVLRYRKNRSCGCNSNAVSIAGNKSKLWTGCGEISGAYYANLKGNAKTRNFELNVTIEYLWNLFLKQHRKCALTGMELSFDTRDWTTDGKASLDRIDSTKGYVVGNVQWIHKDINRMKQNYDELYFVEMCSKVVDYSLKSA